MKNASIGETLFMLFIAIPLSIILSGWTITVLWDWFIVTTFKLQSLTIMQALGLSLMISYFTHQHIKNNDYTAGETFGIIFAKPLTYLLMGWITHLFM